MKQNPKNHWINEMNKGEELLIKVIKFKTTVNAEPYLVAENFETESRTPFYANITEKQANQLKEGHVYKMTCVESKYNVDKKRYFFKYDFQDWEVEETTEKQTVLEIEQERTVDSVIDTVEKQLKYTHNYLKKAIVDIDKYESNIPYLERIKDENVETLLLIERIRFELGIE